MIVCLIITVSCIALVIGSFYFEKWLCKRNNWQYISAPWEWSGFWKWRPWVLYIASAVGICALVGFMSSALALLL